MGTRQQGAEKDVIKRKGSILFALPYAIVGGAEHVQLQLARYLAAHGFALSIITTVKPLKSMGDSTPKFQKVTREIYHLYDFLNTDCQYRMFVEYILESKKIDIIFIAACDSVYHMLPKIHEKYPRIRVVDQLYNEYGHIHNNRRYHDYINLNIVENERVEEVLLKEHGEDPGKVVLIHNGVDVRYFSRSGSSSDATSSSLRGCIPDGKFIVSFIGRFWQEKAPDIFIDVITRLCVNDELFFIMAGNGPLFDEIRSRVRAMGLDRKVLLPGIVDAKQLLQLTDVLVLPSRIDGRPNVVLESLAMGVPAIASGIGGLPQIIRNGENGYLCAVGDVDGIAKRIEGLRADGALRENMRRNARAHAVEHLNARGMLENYLRAFLQLLDKGLGVEG